MKAKYLSEDEPQSKHLVIDLTQYDWANFLKKEYKK